MKSVIKKALCSLLLATVLMGVIQSATADTSVAGKVLDKLNPLLDEYFTDAFDGEDINISTEEFMGKKGTAYFNFDKKKISIAGENTYRTYEFMDENVFVFSVGSICMIIDMYDGFLDLGGKLYWVQNNETKLISADELSQVGAQMATMLN